MNVNLQQQVFDATKSLPLIFIGMCNIYISEQGGKDMMKYAMTPEGFMEIGRRFEEVLLTISPIDKKLKGLKLEDILACLKPEERIAGLKPEERIAGLKPADRIAGLELEDIIGSLSDEDIMAFVNKRGKKGKKVKDAIGKMQEVR